LLSQAKKATGIADNVDDVVLKSDGKSLQTVQENNFSLMGVLIILSVSSLDLSCLRFSCKVYIGEIAKKVSEIRTPMLMQGSLERTKTNAF